jgi:hypothetical protein
MTPERLKDAIRRTNHAVGLMYEAFAATIQDRAKYGRHFQEQAEGPAEMIFKLRKEIDDLIGLTDYVAEFGVPPADAELDAATLPAPAANGSLADHHPAAT